MTFDQIKRAVIAKTSSKKGLPEWYYQRLEQCLGCEWNSANRENIPIMTRIKSAHNLGKEYCTKCTCGVEDKASDSQEQCPLEEPKWLAVETVLQSTLHTIENKSPKKVLLQKEGLYYVLDYGTLEYRSDSEININVTVDGASDVKVSSSCGCTTPEVIREGNVYKISIKYNTTLVGDINGKTVRLDYIKNNIKNQITFLIKGKVEK